MWERSGMRAQTGPQPVGGTTDDDGGGSSLLNPVSLVNPAAVQSSRVMLSLPGLWREGSTYLFQLEKAQE